MLDWAVTQIPLCSSWYTDAVDDAMLAPLAVRILTGGAVTVSHVFPVRSE